MRLLVSAFWGSVLYPHHHPFLDYIFVFLLKSEIFWLDVRYYDCYTFKWLEFIVFL